MLLPPFQPAAVPVLYWRRTFPGRPEQSHAVREFVAALLPDLSRLDEVLLAVAELVANALRHTKSGQGGEFAVDVLHAAGRTAVSVTDQGGPAEPVAADPTDVLAECGRGLRTVSLLADGWGWHGNERGRRVTAVFTTAPGVAPGAAPYGTDGRPAGRAPMYAGDERDPAALLRTLELPAVGATGEPSG